MIEVVTEERIAAPASEVWSVLTDLERYEDWHPWLTIRGVAAPAASITCSLNVAGWGWIYSTDARIKDFQERAALSWVFGIRSVFVMEERFTIEQIATGASLRHSIKCRGLVAALLGRPMKKRLDHLLRSSNYALARHLSSKRSKSPTAATQLSGRRSKTRNGRRRGSRR